MGMYLRPQISYLEQRTIHCDESGAYAGKCKDVKVTASCQSFVDVQPIVVVTIHDLQGCATATAGLPPPGDNCSLDDGETQAFVRDSGHNRQINAGFVLPVPGSILEVVST